MEDDDLKYKFDFTRISLSELVNVVYLAAEAEHNPKFGPKANLGLFEIARKVSLKDVNSIPADMLKIFLREFNDAFIAWGKDSGLLGDVK